MVMSVSMPVLSGLITVWVLFVVITCNVVVSADDVNDADLQSMNNINTTVDNREVDDRNSSKKMNFFQLTDVHIDTLYSEDGDRQISCHVKVNASDKGEKEKLGKYGDFLCDSPSQLVFSAIRQMRKVQPNPDFILWTGDLAPHWASPGPSWSYVFSSLKNITSSLRSSFPTTPILPLLGNHDASPPDAFAVSNSDDMYTDYLTHGGWDTLIEEKDAQKSFEQNCGFYTSNIKSWLRVIVLNTNLYYSNPLVKANDSDPCNQMANFEQALTKASEDTMVTQILVATHVPPGFFERATSKVWPMFNVHGQLGQNITERFVELLTDKRWQGKIKAAFFGHTHTDSFRLFLDHHKVDVVGFIAPSITPHMGLVEGVNPSFRLYDYDAQNGVVVDYQTHLFNITAANEAARKESDENSSDGKEGDRRSRNSKFLDTSHLEKDEASLLEALDVYWTLGYSASDAFQVPDLSPSNMHDVYNSMLYKPNGSVFKTYYRHNSVLHSNEEEERSFECNSTCHLREVCSITNFLVVDMASCMASFDDTNKDTNKENSKDNDKDNNDKDSKNDDDHDVSEDDEGNEDVTSTSSPKEDTSNVSVNDSINMTMDNTMKMSEMDKEADSSSSFPFFPFLLSLLASIILSMIGLAIYRRVRRDRARAQEFLLTDSVFKYDGYSQVEDF